MVGSFDAKLKQLAVCRCLDDGRRWLDIRRHEVCGDFGEASGQKGVRKRVIGRHPCSRVRVQKAAQEASSLPVVLLRGFTQLRDPLIEGGVEGG
jgi:hypothetical protein